MTQSGNSQERKQAHIIYIESEPKEKQIIVQQNESNQVQLIVIIVVGMLASSILTFVAVKLSKAC